MPHIVNSCPLTKFDGGLLRLQEADETAVDWLTTYGSLPFTLPYHMGQTFYRLTLRPLTGPMLIPELTIRLQIPQVQYSLGSLPKCGTIHSQVRAYSL